MLSHTIHPRGKEEELIRPVRNIPGDGKKPGTSLHFPCLSVHVLWNGEDHAVSHDCITWSNSHKKPMRDTDGEIIRDYSQPKYYNTPGGCQYGESPGSFNIKRIEFEFEMLTDKDSNSNRTIKHYKAAAAGGLVNLDFLTMTRKWGSQRDIAGVWTFGEKHPRKRTDEMVATSASFAGMEKLLIGRYGETMAMQILELFLGHELLQKYLSEDSGLKMAA